LLHGIWFGNVILPSLIVCGTFFLVLTRLFMIAYFINSYMHWLAHTIAIVLRKLEWVVVCDC